MDIVEFESRLNVGDILRDKDDYGWEYVGDGTLEDGAGLTASIAEIDRSEGPLRVWAKVEDVPGHRGGSTVNPALSWMDESRVFAAPIEDEGSVLVEMRQGQWTTKDSGESPIDNLVAAANSYWSKHGVTNVQEIPAGWVSQEEWHNSRVPLNPENPDSDLQLETYIPGALVDRISDLNGGEDYLYDVFNTYDEALQLLVRKSADYGPRNIADSPGGPLNGLRVRMWDKMARIKNLTDSGAQPENESLRDSFLDLANYSMIALMVLDGNWPGVGEDQ